MSETIQAIKSGKYDPTALLGILVAAAPDLIALALSADDLPKWAAWTLRAIGVLLAAQGKPVVVKE